MIDHQMVRVFLSGIPTDPQGDVMALALADWLEERGQEQEAQWVRALDLDKVRGCAEEAVENHPWWTEGEDWQPLHWWEALRSESSDRPILDTFGWPSGCDPDLPHAYFGSVAWELTKRVWCATAGEFAWEVRHTARLEKAEDGAEYYRDPITGEIYDD